MYFCRFLALNLYDATRLGALILSQPQDSSQIPDDPFKLSQSFALLATTVTSWRSTREETLTLSRVDTILLETNLPATFHSGEQAPASTSTLM